MFSLAVFIYFVVENYTNTINQRYIALNTEGGECNEVPIVLSGTYLADTAGNWAGSPDFVYSKAAYSLTLSNFEAESHEEYVRMMDTFHKSLVVIGNKAKSENLIYTLLQWMSFVKYYYVEDPSLVDFRSVGYGQLQAMELTGNPSVVFDLPYTQVTISSTHGICPLVADAVYDQANAKLSASYNTSEFASMPSCFAAIVPSKLNIPGFLQKEFSIDVDVRSFATAMAVNMGIIRVTDLGVATPQQTELTFGGAKYMVGEYFDKRYSTMDPILCYYNVTDVLFSSSQHTQQLCFLRKGITIATLPVFHHYGDSDSIPVPCDCDSPVGASAACQEFSLMSSLVFFRQDAPSMTPEDAANKLLKSIYEGLLMVIQYPSYADFNRAAFNASFAASAYPFGTLSAEVTDREWQRESFDFCRIENPPGQSRNCSMLTFYQYNFLYYSVSDYHYQLTNGSCSDSISIPQTQWGKLQAVPPEAISETYFECYPHMDATFINAIGVASGNTSIAMIVFLFLMLPVLYIILAVISQIPSKEEYSHDEKQDAMELLSIILLRLRDGKSRGIKRRGVLAGLAKELMSAAEIETAEEPDSDDEEDEEEEDEEDKAVEVLSVAEGVRRKGQDIESGGSPPKRMGLYRMLSGRHRADSAGSAHGTSGRASNRGGESVKKSGTINRSKLAVFSRQR